MKQEAITPTQWDLKFPIVKNGMDKKLQKIKSMQTILDVVLSTRYVNGAGGARCTKELKKECSFWLWKNQQNSCKFGDMNLKRVKQRTRTQEQYAYTNLLHLDWKNKLSKNECAGILAGAGIEMPMMYKLGYNNKLIA